jgi:hypothetical protein
MRYSSFPGQELKHETERCVQYRRTARGRLDALHFHDQRQLSRKNIDRLKKVFEIDEVRRLEPRNHIPAVVDHFDLDLAMRASDISLETLLTNEETTPTPCY